MVRQWCHFQKWYCWWVGETFQFLNCSREKSQPAGSVASQPHYLTSDLSQSTRELVLYLVARKCDDLWWSQNCSPAATTAANNPESKEWTSQLRICRGFMWFLKFDYDLVGSICVTCFCGKKSDWLTKFSTQRKCKILCWQQLFPRTPFRLSGYTSTAHLLARLLTKPKHHRLLLLFDLRCTERKGIFPWFWVGTYFNFVSHPFSHSESNMKTLSTTHRTGW